MSIGLGDMSSRDQDSMNLSNGGLAYKNSSQYIPLRDKPQIIPSFEEFPSISRLSREMVITEKIDGTNASVTVLMDGRVVAGSRTRYITVADDNYGFAKWVKEHEDVLRVGLGYGVHFGEWWGSGIQRRYGLNEKRFSLFNVGRWTSQLNLDPLLSPDSTTNCIEVPCCHVVPTLYRGIFDTTLVDKTLLSLSQMGSIASRGFKNPEGVVVYHEKSRTLFKKTLDKNDGHKGS